MHVSERDEQRSMADTRWIAKVAPVRKETCGQTDVQQCSRAQEDDVSAIRVCPSCRCADVPHLIVRFGDFSDGGLSWRCRECFHEWADAFGVRPLDGFESPLEPVPSGERSRRSLAIGLQSPHLA
jgi:hypothetical protein